MSTTQYTIQFFGEGFSYTHKDNWGRDAYFNYISQVDEVIRETFEDPKIKEAVVYSVESTTIRSVINTNTEDQRAERKIKAKDQIFNALKELSLSERKTIIAEFYKDC